MGGPIDMIFGVFSETYVRLLEGISSQFFSRYSKSYNLKTLELKTQRFLTNRRAAFGPPNYMYLIQPKSFLE